MGLKIHLVRFLVLRTIHGTLVAEVGINSRRVFDGGIAGIASGGFFLENSRTKNSRRECRLSVPAIPVGASVRAYVVRPIQAKKPYDPQKRLKIGLIWLYWYKTTKTDYKPK